MEQDAVHFRCLNNDLLATLDQVRQLGGFQDFLLPKRLSTLQDAAIDAPVVIINTNDSGSDALIMSASALKHVPLPDLSEVEAHALVKLIQTITSSDTRQSEATRAHSIDSELKQIHIFSSSSPLRFLKQSIEARHVGRASAAGMLTEEIFELILAALWVSVVEPIIRCLDLKVRLKCQQVLI